MQVFYKINIASDSSNPIADQLAVLTIRTEHKLLIGKEELRELRRLDMPLLGQQEIDDTIVSILNADPPFPLRLRKHFDTGFQEIKNDNQGITLDLLARILSILDTSFNVWIEGVPPSAVTLMIGRPSHTFKFPLNRESIERRVTEIHAIRESSLANGGDSKLINLLDNIGEALDRALIAWMEYERWKDEMDERLRDGMRDAFLDLFDSLGGQTYDAPASGGPLEQEMNDWADSWT